MGDRVLSYFDFCAQAKMGNSQTNIIDDEFNATKNSIIDFVLVPNVVTDEAVLFNPTNSVINKINIYDVTGRNVTLNFGFDFTQNNTRIKSLNASTGNYLLQICSGTTVNNIRFTVNY